MKKRICLILSIILVLPLILFGYGLSLPSYYGDSYYGELSELYERLNNTEGKKIVVLGNSNVAFGLDSASLEGSLKEHGFDYTVCNFGLYAAVGTSAMLALSEDCIGEGDLVVLAIEPSSEAFSTYFGATAMLKCAEDSPELLLHLNSDQRSAVVGNYIEYLQDRAEIHRSGILPEVNGVYAKASFDERGDMTYERAGNTMTLGYDTASPIDLEGLTFEDEFVDQVNNYIASARKKGVEVVMTFSPMNRSAVKESDEETLYRFFLSLVEAFDCSVISDPGDYLMDSGWFYDSNVHLNSAGMKVRTHNLLLDLLTYWGCSDKVAFDMPEMPDSIAGIAEDDGDWDDNADANGYADANDSADVDDNADADDNADGYDYAYAEAFLFEEIGENGLIVTGLTEAGIQKTSLILPAAVNGKTVIGISADALLHNQLLTDLTLPSTIESIPDGLFAACPSITSLTLLHKNQIPSVGSGLLQGTRGLTIYVTKEAYSLYRDGAGCAANGWELYEDILVPLS